MLEGRMRSIHLLQHREHVLMLLWIDGVCEHGGDCRLVDATSGGQPNRNRAEVTQRPDRRLIEGVARECRDELAKTRLIFRPNRETTSARRDRWQTPTRGSRSPSLGPAVAPGRSRRRPRPRSYPRTVQPGAGAREVLAPFCGFVAERWRVHLERPPKAQPSRREVSGGVLVVGGRGPTLFLQSLALTGKPSVEI
jgi:hypothetical protein